MAPKVVIFDLDGTLLDTVADLGKAVNYALGRRGFPLHERAAYRRMIGHGIRNLVTVALPADLQGDEALIDACLADFKAYYTTHIDVFTRPYDGIPALLAELRDAGISLAVASNKFQAGTEALIHEFFPDIPFVAILGNREGAPLKPDPAIVREVLRAASPSQAQPHPAATSSRPADGQATHGDTGNSTRPTTITPATHGDTSAANGQLPGPADGQATGTLPTGELPGMADGQATRGDTGTADGQASSAMIGQMAAETIMIGDAPSDIETARNSGIRAIAVGWGYRDMSAAGVPLATTVPALRALLLG